MRILSALSRRVPLARLGVCALLLLPVAASAQTEEKKADKPADDTAYTLRLKFKKDDVNRYKSVMKLATKLPGIDEGQAKDTAMTMRSISVQKTKSVADNGSAEIEVTTANAKMQEGDKTTDVPAVPALTMQETTLGKILSSKSASQSANPTTDLMIKMLGADGITSIPAFLPENPVKVGDKWSQKITLPGGLSGGEGTVDCTFVRVENVAGAQTALIHLVLKAPIAMMLDTAFQPTQIENNAIAVMSGPMSSTMDINFAIEAGKIVRRVSDLDTTLGVKPGKGATPEIASLIPDTKTALKLSIKEDLLAPGEKVEDKPETKPETKETPKK